MFYVLHLLLTVEVSEKILGLTVRKEYFSRPFFRGYVLDAFKRAFLNPNQTKNFHLDLTHIYTHLRVTPAIMVQQLQEPSTITTSITEKPQEILPDKKSQKETLVDIEKVAQQEGVVKLEKNESGDFLPLETSSLSSPSTTLDTHSASACSLSTTNETLSAALSHLPLKQQQQQQQQQPQNMIDLDQPQPPLVFSPPKMIDIDLSDERKELEPISRPYAQLCFDPQEKTLVTMLEVTVEDGCGKCPRFCLDLPTAEEFPWLGETIMSDGSSSSLDSDNDSFSESKHQKLEPIVLCGWMMDKDAAVHDYADADLYWLLTGGSDDPRVRVGDDLGCSRILRKLLVSCRNWNAKRSDVKTNDPPQKVVFKYEPLG